MSTQIVDIHIYEGIGGASLSATLSLGIFIVDSANLTQRLIGQYFDLIINL